jgi:hypothetical protein
MNLSKIVAAAGVLATGLMLTSAPAQAFSFSTNFTAATTANGKQDATRDIRLNSVSFNGQTVSNFAFVQSAQIISNDAWTGGNTGAASSDRGDNASGQNLEAATHQSVAASLGNSNLNNIIDGEDRGSFRINLMFGQAVSNLFFWERGMNSDLTVQALDQLGNVVGNSLKITRSTWKSAGYQINTTEIGGAQNVGSWGLGLGELGLSNSIYGVQVSADASHNGPDFKVVGGATGAPEPVTMAGLALAGAGLAAARRRRKRA